MIQNQLTDSKNRIWNGWDAFGTFNIKGDLKASYNADGRLTLFWRDNSSVHSLGAIDQMALNSSEWQIEWTYLAESGVRSWAVVRDVTMSGKH